jgi:hypothetical protein
MAGRRRRDSGKTRRKISFEGGARGRLRSGRLLPGPDESGGGSTAAAKVVTERGTIELNLQAPQPSHLI